MVFISIQCVMKENHSFVSEQQLNNIYSEINLPVDFQQIDSSITTRRESNLETHFYKSSLSYSEAKEFFTTSLADKNWIYDKEEMFESISANDNRKRFGYKKEGCELWIEYNGLSSRNIIFNNFNYGVSLVC